MTRQLPDVLRLDGDELWLEPPPLEQQLTGDGLVLHAPHTACWRGYTADWSVRAGQLWLDRVQAWTAPVGPPTTLGMLAGRPLPCVADWVVQVLHARAAGTYEGPPTVQVDVVHGQLEDVRRPAVAPLPVPQGPVIGRFAIGDVLAFGGFSTVYEAVDTQDGADVVLKLAARGGSRSGTRVVGRYNAGAYRHTTDVWPPVAATWGPVAVDRLFEAEAAELAWMDGDGLPRLVEAGVHRGVPYLVMERLDNPWDVSRATPEQLVQLLERIARFNRSGADHHGDLKPEHVFRGEDGSFAFVDPGWEGEDGERTWTPEWNPWCTGGALQDVVAVALLAWVRYAGELPEASRTAAYARPPAPPPLGQVSPAPRGLCSWVDTVLAWAADRDAPGPAWLGSASAAAAELRRLTEETPVAESAEHLLPRTRSGLDLAVPVGWFVKESWTLLHPSGRCNVIASTEPLDPAVDTARYAEVQGDLLRKDFPGFRELSSAPMTLASGHQARVRDFRWVPPDGQAVRQVQLYYAESGRGFTATATCTEPETELYLAQLRLVLHGLRIV